MPHFVVDVLEVHTMQMHVEAATAEAAREQANQLLEEGVEGDTRYTRTLPPDEWNVRQTG